MKAKSILTIAGLALMFGAANALAQDDDTEATMTLMEHLDAKLPAAVINDIALPEHLMSGEGEDLTTAERNSKKGIDTANASRDNRLGSLETADAASAQGFEMREAAEENRANMGRSEENRQDPPETPEPPTPPGPSGPSGGG